MWYDNFCISNVFVYHKSQTSQTQKRNVENDQKSSRSPFPVALSVQKRPNVRKTYKWKLFLSDGFVYHKLERKKKKDVKTDQKSSFLLLLSEIQIIPSLNLFERPLVMSEAFLITEWKQHESKRSIDPPSRTEERVLETMGFMTPWCCSILHSESRRNLLQSQCVC